MRYTLLVAFVLACHVNYAQQAATATSSTSIISTDCWSNNPVIATSTQQNSLAVFENYVYTVFYNTERYLCISRSDNYGIDNWKTVVLSHCYEMRNGVYDNHNTPNIAISPKDKRIHLSFDMHARDLRYMISTENLAVAPDSLFTAEKFGAVRDYLTEDKTTVTQVTYPRFIIGNDSTLIFSYRGLGGSGNANSYIATYRNDGYWNTPIQIVNGKTGTYSGAVGSSSTRCAYFNDFVYKSGVIYLTWMWRETPDMATNHDLMFAYSEDNGATWKNTNNNSLSVPMHLNSNGLKVASIPQNTDLINHNGCAVDGSGNVHVVVRAGSIYTHYYRIGTQWRSQIIDIGGFAGDRPKLYCDSTTNTLYMLIRRGDELRLFASYPNGEQWDEWTRVKGISDSYVSASNSFITDDGKILRTMAVTSENELHLITWNLTSYSPLITPADTIKELGFKNIYHTQEIDLGTNLSIEATVGSAYKEVSLWSGTNNLGTLTSAPYVWSGHPILTNMTEPSYTF